MSGFGEQQKKKKKSSPQFKTQTGGEVLHKMAVDHHMRGDLVSAEKAYREAIKAGYMHPDVFSNLGVIGQYSGRPEEAILLYEKAIKLNPKSPNAYSNLGSIYKDLGQLDQALASTLKSPELKPENPTAHTNLGGIYKELGQLDQALAATLKSLELKPDNPVAHMNLGWIYKELGQLDHALASTLKSLEIKSDPPVALTNLKVLIDEIKLSSTNAQNLTKTYELLINLENFSHKKLSRVFIQAFLETIKLAAKFDLIISADNNALTSLASDWRLRKSLALFIPPHQEIEHFLTRLRKELIGLAANQQKIPDNLKALMEALATQCFLNEYVYAQSPEEEEMVNLLIHALSRDQETFNQYLAITGSYVPIYLLSINQEWLENYPTDTYESRTFITTQLDEPKEEVRIRATIQIDSEVTNAVSVKVQEMYEANPYPRYRYADHVDKSSARIISKVIGIESTKSNLQFAEALTSNQARPKVLIAGCGTGNQVITSSRYKNAQITAIDLSSSSLAYAIRKVQEYGMDNVDFRKMDLLDVAALDERFDTIECSGVLHHMEDPAKWLSALNQQLKPGGYIKLALYSEIARQDIVKARNQIKHLGINSTPNSIRGFRQQVLREEYQQFTSLPNFGLDFYSLSECRDLCFHVQEFRFSTELLQKLLSGEGLIFCGFMVPEAIRTNYQQQFPSDTDMNSLENWGYFEKQNPSTFRRMYQFWAYKPS